MSAREILDRHAELVETIHALLQQENQYLRDHREPSAEVVATKQRLLPELQASLEAIKTLQLRPEERTNQLRQQKQKLEQQLMRLFLLDRENEKLLLEAAQTRTPRVAPRRASLNDIQKAYQRGLRPPATPAGPGEHA